MKQELHNEPNLFGPDLTGRTAQQAGATGTGAKAPKETPPNNDSAARQPIIPLKDPPWNEWLRLARQGDKEATLRFCTQAEPFIRKLCNDTLFRSRLGKDETRGEASLILMEFLMEFPDPPDDKEVPILLKGILRRRLLNRVNKLKMLNRREQRAGTLQGGDEEDAEVNALEVRPASRKEEPEAKLLARELHTATANAVSQLQPNEKELLRAVFFQNKTVAAIAKELRCTRQNVEKLRDRALRRLRQLLEGQHICGCGA